MKIGVVYENLFEKLMSSTKQSVDTQSNKELKPLTRKSSVVHALFDTAKTKGEYNYKALADSTNELVEILHKNMLTVERDHLFRRKSVAKLQPIGSPANNDTVKSKSASTLTRVSELAAVKEDANMEDRIVNAVPFARPL